MVTVDTIGRVRRAHFVQGRAIKAIARELRLSRNTVRDIVRGGAEGETERSYVRREQPLPQLGRLRAAVGSDADGERRPAEARAADLPAACSRNCGSKATRAATTASAAMAGPGPGARASGQAEAFVPLIVRAGRGLPVRLEPRDSAVIGRRGGAGEGGADAALPQPDAVRAGLSARDPGDGVRRAREGVRVLQGRCRRAVSTTT